MPLAAGTRLDSFEIVAPLGAGGMGDVYRARDVTLKRDVAIKVLPDYWSRDAERLRRFKQEAQATAALNHPNIVSIFHVGQFDGSPYLVTELLHGETLRERLHTGSMRIHEVLDNGKEMARGLAAAHDAGVVHRDLKPENIWVTKDGRIKILDFGLAKLDPVRPAGKDAETVGLEPRSYPGQVLGTVGYMSPEQVRGQPADARSDIFAVGVILYEMLTGKPPFRKDTSAETMTAILNEDPPPISQLSSTTPPVLQRIVSRCLMKSPEQRFQHAADVAFALEAMSDAAGAYGSRDAQFVPVRKWLWLAAAGGSIVIAVALLWLTRSPAVPVVEEVIQITNDGIPKQGPLLTDGARIYFKEGATGSWKIAQVSAAGGETSEVVSRLQNPLVEALAPDGSFLLVKVNTASWGGPGELWSIPLPTGEPRPFGNILAREAGFFPDGRLAFTHGPELSIADSNGSNIHKLLTSPDSLFCPQVSPDGKQIVFLEWPLVGDSTTIAEVGADGAGAQDILRSHPGETLRCATWSRDAKYLIYQANHLGNSDIWLKPLRSSLPFGDRKPIQLTNGALYFEESVMSKDGKRIFTIGTKLRGEVVRYDMISKEFVPFLSGISATDISFSRDGNWVAYISHPDRNLWRSRADGSDRLQLTFSPMEVQLPVISQDGRQVAFRTSIDEVYVIGIDGGPLRKINVKNALTGTLSPDGNQMVLSIYGEGAHLGERGEIGLGVFDLRTGVLSPIPASRGIFGAFWVNPDTLVAVTDDMKKIMSFDFRTARWTLLASGHINNWMPSPDGKYMYYATAGSEPEAMRVRIADKHLERIASLKDLRRVVEHGTQISVAPDGSPVFTRDIGSQEIYSLTVKWP